MRILQPLRDGAVAAWAMLGHPPAWGLALAVLVLAAGQAFFRPALQAILRQSVAPECHVGAAP